MLLKHCAPVIFINHHLTLRQFCSAWSSETRGNDVGRREVEVGGGLGLEVPHRVWVSFQESCWECWRFLHVLTWKPGCISLISPTTCFFAMHEPGIVKFVQNIGDSPTPSFPELLFFCVSFSTSHNFQTHHHCYFLLFTYLLLFIVINVLLILLLFALPQTMVASIVPITPRMVICHISTFKSAERVIEWCLCWEYQWATNCIY